MKAGLAVFVLAMSGPPAQADVFCKHVDSDGTRRCGNVSAEAGGPKLNYAAEVAIEPAPGYPNDPGKSLREDTERSRGYRCVVENELRRKTCIDGAAIRANGDLRAAELLIGRPERVRATGIDLVVDCRVARSTLRRRDGAPFTGELPVTPHASKLLSAALCSEKATIPDPHLAGVLP